MNRADLSNAYLSGVMAIRMNFGRTLAEGAVFDRAIFLQAGFGGAAEPEPSSSDAEPAIEPGWTFTSEESYCPICADVRAHTWGAHRQDNEPQGKKR